MKIIVYMAVSANGMVSNKKGVPDWLSPEYEQGFVRLCSQTKAVIMGKGTYQILAPDYLPLKNEGTMVVRTRKPAINSESNIVFTDKSPAEIISVLERRGHSEAVIIGGPITVSEFMKAGLVNELYLVVEPVLFANGLPFFQNADFEYRMSLLEERKLNGNTVQLMYRLNYT
jgi:dihydrofolate reductase